MAELNPTVKFKPGEEEDHIELSTAPNPRDDEDHVEVSSPAKNRYNDAPLNPALHNSLCCGRIPILFERAAHTWWNLQFDSKILENQHKKTFATQTSRSFRFALAYVICSCVVWCIYFAANQKESWMPFLIGTVALLLTMLAVLGFTYTKLYERFVLATSVAVSLVLCVFVLLSFCFGKLNMTAVGTFTESLEVIILMYTVIPMPLYVCFVLSIVYSIIYEVMFALLSEILSPLRLGGMILMHMCIHLIGIHIYIMLHTRRRSTFLKVGNLLMVRDKLEDEKQLKEKMIHSLMPPSVAEEVIRSQAKENKEIDVDEIYGRQTISNEPKIRFRAFHMSQMDKVSILYADIVGFTKMSSNKTAEVLVSLLNDLFGRFDDLCTKSGCEKISTLGDCYYCVSGCPEPREDHAKCCVEMGLGMIVAIKQFDKEKNEEVNMRVGVHTGNVLCGIVGSKRFKFDVWSNDVTLANMMESEGMPGRVHISEATLNCLNDEYEVEYGKKIDDIRKHKVLIEDYDAKESKFTVRHIRASDFVKTYFIVQRKNAAGSEAASPSDEIVGTDQVDVQIADESTKDGKERSTASANHAEDQPSKSPESSTTNGMSPTALLGRRNSGLFSTHDISSEDLSQQKDGEVRLAIDQKFVFMEETLTKAQQVRIQRDMKMVGIIEKVLQSADRTKNKGQGDTRGIGKGHGKINYFFKPPINKFTLNFDSAKLEKNYRNHYLQDTKENATVSSPQFSALLDMFVSFIFLSLVSICCFIGFPIRVAWIVFFVIAMTFELLMIIPLFTDVHPQKNTSENKSKIRKVAMFFARWYPRHCFGFFITTIPVAAVYTNFSCGLFDIVNTEQLYYFCFLISVSLLHFQNFTMLSSWLKSCLAVLAGVVLIIILGLDICKLVTPSVDSTAYSLDGAVFNSTVSTLVVGMSTTMNGSGTVVAIDDTLASIKYEIIIDMFLLLLLICFLNREFEISYRHSFHADVETVMDRKKMETEKEQAEWLLHNIIPKHVSEQLKSTNKFSKNYKDVGVIFAKIVNFDEFYDESYEGGREYLRVLNEMISDFEDLFNEERFKDIEKIKTIGACFMAASGLDTANREKNKNPKAHLYALMDFCIELLKVIDTFNESMLNFDFQLAIGYNIGEVTAGVIGFSKFHYDIWGDTVNISSRMYSTGVNGRIQLTEDTVKKVDDMFDFTPRGEIFVKGKGNMKTYLLERKKPGATWS